MKLFIILVFSIFISWQPIIIAQQENGHGNMASNDSIISELISHVNQDSVQSYIQSLEDFETRFMIAPNRKEVANWIGNKFISLGVENVRIDSVLCDTYIDFMSHHYDTTTWQYNVIATIPGIENPDEFFVIGAHYDDIVSSESEDPMLFAPGADDNASGVAALFEIIRIFSTYKYHPKTSIEFVAFAAEELMGYGDSGSLGYVNQAIESGMDIKLMVNNDMIANTDSNDWKIQIFNFVGSEWLSDIAVDITSNYTEIEPLLSEPMTEAFCDCEYFYEAGVPCVYFMEEDFNLLYHTEEDLVANCELDYCAEAIKISLGVLVTADNMVTQVNELKNKLSYNIFPNPCNNKLVVEIPDNLIYENLSFKLSDIHGRIVIDKYQVKSHQVIFEVSHLKSGIYMLSIYSKTAKESVLISVQ